MSVSLAAAAPSQSRIAAATAGRWLEILGAWMLGVLWILPLL